MRYNNFNTLNFIAENDAPGRKEKKNHKGFEMVWVQLANLFIWSHTFAFAYRSGNNTI